jgi:DNA-directed RNA polymerase subunit RPC12/RpoP
MAATHRGMNIPTKVTLAKYGMSEADFRLLVDAQDGRCAVCDRTPSTGRVNIDHAHVKGWKKLPPGARRATVRAILCWYCNHKILAKGVTAIRLRAAAAYLERFSEDEAFPFAAKEAS